MQPQPIQALVEPKPLPPAPDKKLLRRLALASLSLPAEQLEGECDRDFFIASGPGGQHRNKTESGVRLKHRPTGLVVTATERRSQAHNRSEALKRLRSALQELTVVERPRVPTRVSRGAKRRRLEDKRLHSEKKKDRSGGGDW